MKTIIISILRHLNEFIICILCTGGVPCTIRALYLNILGHKVEWIHSHCVFNFGKGRLVMGRNSDCAIGCYFDLHSDITIGSNTLVASNTMFITSSHKIGDTGRRAALPIHKPIVVGEGCWIGANVTILPGVVIGDGVVVGAGSLVNKNLLPNSVYVGVPAKLLRKI